MLPTSARPNRVKHVAKITEKFFNAELAQTAPQTYALYLEIPAGPSTAICTLVTLQVLLLMGDMRTGQRGALAPQSVRQ